MLEDIHLPEVAGIVNCSLDLFTSNKEFIDTRKANLKFTGIIWIPRLAIEKNGFYFTPKTPILYFKN